MTHRCPFPLAFGTGTFADDGKVRDLLRRVGLERHAGFLPGRLSGREKQRATIARALINDPLVVFADEPTGNLDSVNGRMVLDLLEEHTVRVGRTLVLVTHDPALAARQVHLVDGRLAPV